ncbi:ran-specific GTPase-activating protein [Astyanax mexicanus]|uniref:Ran-specific GTPase-activating protein n=2 Tax=Astyanax mexicanus TaxID=7994 RepID=A0A8T2KQF6_ASTMX|nr:ran-specific GTPase-activating protein [Astyanax mexicanus]
MTTRRFSARAKAGAFSPSLFPPHGRSEKHPLKLNNPQTSTKLWQILRRAKLYRFASENDPPEWKERGTGDVKLLRHKEKGSIRLLMRRDRTLKICANHHIMPLMELKPNAGSDRAWVWNTHADFADEEPKPELLAIRFLNAENAQKFKVKFDECKEEVRKFLEDVGDSATKVAEKLGDLSVKDEKTKSSEKEEKKEKSEGEVKKEEKEGEEK